jgi:hypothetical protein
MTTYYKLGGKQRPIRFGYGAIYQFEKATGQSVLSISAKFEKGEMFLSDIIELIWAGYTNGCRAEKLNASAEKQELFDWLDEMPQEMLEAIMNQFGESFNGGNPNKQKSEEITEEKN